MRGAYRRSLSVTPANAGAQRRRRWHGHRHLVGINQERFDPLRGLNYLSLAWPRARMVRARTAKLARGRRAHSHLTAAQGAPGRAARHPGARSVCHRRAVAGAEVLPVPSWSANLRGYECLNSQPLSAGRPSNAGEASQLTGGGDRQPYGGRPDSVIGCSELTAAGLCPSQ